MKVLLLGAGSAIHTQRWANGLAEAGLDVVCASQHAFLPGAWDARVVQVRLPVRGPAGYFLNAGAVRRLFLRHRCDLMNVHYATGYGVLGTLSRVRPRLVSVWGSDVYDFPAASPAHRALVQGVLRSADRVASTSEAMAGQIVRLMGARALDRPVAVTPFGVDTARFAPAGDDASGTGTGTGTGSDESGGGAVQVPVIGTVKVLAPKYGIDTLIRAFTLLGRPYGGPAPCLRIVGDGPQRADLEALAARLGVADRVTFAGAVPHAEVPAALRALDVFVAASRLDSESFGVAVVEASACGLPVVVTSVGGLPEVVADGETGLIVPPEDPMALAAALRRLVGDAALRRQLGTAGRARVQHRYEWRATVRRMVGVYEEVVAASRAKTPAGRTA